MHHEHCYALEAKNRENILAAMLHYTGLRSILSSFVGHLLGILNCLLLENMQFRNQRQKRNIYNVWIGSVLEGAGVAAACNSSQMKSRTSLLVASVKGTESHSA